MSAVLITNQESEAIQGSPIKDIKSSTRADEGFRVAQCFYTAAEFSKSVSVSLCSATQAARPHAARRISGRKDLAATTARRKRAIKIRQRRATKKKKKPFHRKDRKHRRRNILD